MGFEVVVRPAVFPDIRPAPARRLAPQDNPEQGICTMTGGGLKFMGTSDSWSVNVSRTLPHQEAARQFDTERVYQVDDNGNINRNNFVDVERLKKVRLNTSDAPIRVEYVDPPPRDNVEIKEKDQVRYVDNPNP
jgi:hypothetical protein